MDADFRLLASRTVRTAIHPKKRDVGEGGSHLPFTPKKFDLTIFALTLLLLTVESWQLFANDCHLLLLNKLNTLPNYFKKEI